MSGSFADYLDLWIIIMIAGLAVGLIAGLIARSAIFWPKQLFLHLFFYALAGIVGVVLTRSILNTSVVLSIPGAVVVVLIWTWISAIKARDADGKVRTELPTAQKAAPERTALETLAAVSRTVQETLPKTTRDQAAPDKPAPPSAPAQQAKQTRIFISYKREGDAALAGRIADRLGNEFGPDHVFMDVDAMPLGVDFVEAINEEVAKCDVLLAIIGPRWLELIDTNQDMFVDFVHHEIAAALKRKIPVIPILVDGTKMPPADRLAEEIRGLARRNALNLRHDSFRADMDRLVRELKAGKGS